MIIANILDFFLRFTGMRDRLRCPHCGAIGTWKMHGSAWDRSDVRHAVRWMCKWCGAYKGPEGIRKVAPSSKGYWDFDGDLETPAQRCRGVFPWRG